ncbi:MAG: LPS assembly protein LptD [Pseudomonadota bacterium]
MPRALSALAALLSLLHLAQSAQAAPVCEAPGAIPVAPFTPRDDDAVQILADRVESLGRTRIRAEGAIEFQHQARYLRAEQLEFDKDAGFLKAQGDILLQEDGLAVTGTSAEFNTDAKRIKIIGGAYQLGDTNGHGGAAELEITPTRIRLSEASYSTCPPGEEDWLVRASSIRLQPAKNLGEATHMRLEFMDVPFLYLPYVQFPLGARKTGFLVPVFGTSNSTGEDIQLPFYINIAPPLDATLTPRWMSRRGDMLMGEFRYLSTFGTGRIEAEYLEEDKVTNTERDYFAFHHQGVHGRVRHYADFAWVSDVDYLRDLSTQREEVSAAVLERDLGVNYLSETRRFDARLVGFQNLDERLGPGEEPYQSLPQLRLQGYQPLNGWLTAEWDAELVYFDQDRRPAAARLDLQPALAVNLTGEAGYFKPRLALRDTRYRLAEPPAGASHPARTVPIFSLDTGINAERTVAYRNSTYRQTLEPRLFYLHVPFRNQEGLVRDEAGHDIVFDTLEAELDFDQLFRTNRFIGADRQSDADQLTAVLTSRLFDDEGQQRLRLRASQTYYFKDQRVVLPGESPETATRSDLLAGFDVRLHKYWHLDGLAQLASEDFAPEHGKLRIIYRGEQERYFDWNLNYRRELVKQSGILVRWPLGQSWIGVVQWDYSFLLNQTLKATLALGYEDCCWSLRMAARRYIDENDGSSNTAFAVQFELKGFTSIGTSIAGFEK